MAKRKSGGGQGGVAKSQKQLADLHVPVDVLLQNHVKCFDDWLRLDGDQAMSVKTE